MGKCVNTQMGGAFSSNASGSSMPQADSMTKVGSHAVHTKVSLGEKKASTITPTQTAADDGRPPRPGTKQYDFGKSKT